MRKTVRAFSQVGPEQRLANAIRGLPPSARRALADVAERDDLPLVAGDWSSGDSGCLVANVVRAFAAPDDRDLTLDLRVLELFPEMSSRDLNHLIVAWDEAAQQEGRDGDPALRRLLRGALAAAGEAPAGAVLPADAFAGDPVGDPGLAALAADPATDEPPVVPKAPLGVPSRV
jgi:hypothetical protein